MRISDWSSDVCSSDLSMPGMDMSTMAMDQSEGGTDLPAGTAPPPPPPQDHAADRVYPPAAMAEAREEFREEQGGRELYQIMFNLAEVQVRDGKDGYRSEEHTSELQSLMRISYAVFCLKKKTQHNQIKQ